MNLFFKTFIKIFAILSSISIFCIVLFTLSSFFNKIENKEFFTHTSGDINSQNKIAILKLVGPILNEPHFISDYNLFNNASIIYVNKIKKILKKLELEKIKGLIISINSPGGSVSASFNLYNLFKEFKNKNKIVLIFHTNELMTSGAYWTALSGNKIFANYGSLIGSIGVKGPDWIYFDEPIVISNGLLGNSVVTKKGIKKFNNIAGNSKDIFDPFRPPTKKERIDLQNAVQNIYNDFVNEVSSSRKIEKDIILNDIGAMIYDTKSAKEKFLIDGTATQEKVIKIMAEYLNFDNFQVIEKENFKSSFIEKIIGTNFLSNNFFNDSKSLQSYLICKITKFQLSSIIIQNNMYSSC
jgi:protease-4|tara:strand:- start:3042 stop:4103 length:1062 start_codon:yes stop_codon:yes gene_type:complete